MSYNILDRLNSEDDTKRIEQLETELERVGKAFEDYIATTEGLEVDVKKELGEMQTKLNYSTKANEELVNKLKSMESLFKNLELSSEGIRKKLKNETKLRRQAEQTLTETELELRSKMVRIRQLERNDSSALRIVDSGVITETVNNTTKAFTDRDLEAVTDELISTQEKLIKTEEQLLRSQTLVQDLERNIQNIDNDALASLSGDDKELLRELDEIRAEIGATRSEDIQSRSAGTEQSKEKEINFESQLKESREENTTLVEEIACLRNILYDKDGSKTAMVEKGEKSVRDENEDHQIEVESLRKKIEETVHENMTLQEKVQRLEMFGSSQEAQSRESASEIELRQTKDMLRQSKLECSEMRSEILSLSESLYNANKWRGRGNFDMNGLKRQDNELLSARNELVDKNREISTLENNLISTQEEVRKLSKEISNMSSSFEKTQEEYNSIVEELQQTESALAAAKDSRATQETKMKKLQLVAEKTPQKDAEIQVLRSQFKKLSEKNEILSQQVKDVMGDVASLREKQDKVNVESKTRLTTAKELQNDIVHAVSESRQRNHEVEELTVMMEKRMGLTELSVEALDSEIAVAMKKLQSAQVLSSEKKIESLLSVVQTESQSVEIDLESVKTEEKENVALAESVETEEKESPTEEKESPKETVVTEERESLMEVVGTEEKETSIALDSIESVLDRTRRLLEVSETVQKLSLVSRSLREGRLNENDQASVSSVSLPERKASKYEEIIKKVADFESLYSNENRELEADGDDGIEVRE